MTAHRKDALTRLTAYGGWCPKSYKYGRPSTNDDCPISFADAIPAAVFGMLEHAAEDPLLLMVRVTPMLALLLPQWEG